MKVTVIPIVIGALGTVLKRLVKGAGRYGNQRKTIQTTALLVGLLGFMAYQPLSVIYHQIFYLNNQFYFKQFSLAWVLDLIVKNISISNYSSSYI